MCVLNISWKKIDKLQHQEENYFKASEKLLHLFSQMLKFFIRKYQKFTHFKNKRVLKK